MKVEPHPLPEGPPETGPRLITGRLPEGPLTTAAQTTEACPSPHSRGEGWKEFWRGFVKALAALSIGLVIGGAISLVIFAFQ